MAGEKKIIAVVGPTATGKTALGVELAKHLNGEVISADSRLVYRELAIGTAKPTAEERQDIPHHMIDLINPDETYSVSLYQSKSLAILHHLFELGKTPIIVGGTGLYVRALLQEGFFPDIPPDMDFRNRMNQLAAERGHAYLHELLAQKDPARAAQLHPNDQVRVVRALEIIEQTGKSIPVVNESREFDTHWIGLTFEDRDLLRKRIADRMTVMFESGWLEEVKTLLSKYGPDVQALKVAHGYPELVSVLQNRMTLDEAKRQIEINTRQYARRQLTWFRPNREIQWFEIDKIPQNALIERVLVTTNTA